MDIIITLPQELWIKIVTGEKSVEMRKWNLPEHFDVTLDKVFVVPKGTKRVVGCFRVEGLTFNPYKSIAWNEFGDKLGVSYEWYDKYWGEYDIHDMYFYHIGDCHVLGSHRNVQVERAPQRYINIDNAWESLVNF